MSPAPRAQPFSLPDLPIGQEPAELRRELAAFAASGSSANAELLAKKLADRQWRLWRGELVTRGVTAARFRATVLGYRREIWLWALGDRSWEPMMAGLRGRVLRHLALEDDPVTR